MKKTVLLITALVLSIALCACGKSKDTTPPTITMTTTSFTIDYGCEFDITTMRNISIFQTIKMEISMCQS